MGDLEQNISALRRQWLTIMIVIVRQSQQWILVEELE
jgi:hypothetical protein